MAPADSAVHNPQLLPVSDDRKAMEQLLHIMESNVTEEDMRDINAAAQFNVIFNDGTSTAFCLNLTNGQGVHNDN